MLCVCKRMILENNPRSAKGSNAIQDTNRFGLAHWRSRFKTASKCADNSERYSAHGRTNDHTEIRHEVSFGRREAYAVFAAYQVGSHSSSVCNPSLISLSVQRQTVYSSLRTRPGDVSAFHTSQCCASGHQRSRRKLAAFCVSGRRVRPSGVALPSTYSRCSR